MRLVFMGTPDFAATILTRLAETYNVVAVYSRPDAVSGRGSTRRPSAVKQSAMHLGLPVLEPSTLRTAEAVGQLRALEPDIVIVAAYGMILPADILSVPPLGCINVHASLLPRWRGAAPVQWAILDGDATTGVSIMRMDEGLDTGAYCLQKSTETAEKNATELTAELARLGADALIESLPAIVAGECEWVDQDDEQATYARKVAKVDVALSPDLSVAVAERRVRASSAQAPARASVAGKNVTITHVSEIDRTMERGTVLFDRELYVGLNDGTLWVQSVKPDGKSEMTGADWARGLRLKGDECWEGVL